MLLGLIAAAFVPALVEFQLGDDATALAVLAGYGLLILIALPGIGLWTLTQVPELP